MKTLSTAAQAAKMVRSELTKLFPGTKFSVRSSYFAGGNSVDVSWTDGPTSEMVRPIVKKYQYGSFDGMTDSYNYDNENTSIPQVKYVTAQRTCSEEFRNVVKQKLMENYGLTEWPADNNDKPFGCWPWEKMNRALSKNTYPFTVYEF